MVAAAVLLSAIAPLILLTAPMVVGALITLYGFTPQQAGLSISVELGAMSLAGLPALWWMPRHPWRPFVVAALLLLVAANLACTLVHSFAALTCWRLLSGLGGGTLMVVAMSAIAGTHQPERNFGWWTVGQLAMGALALALLPQVLPWVGLHGLYVALAVLLAAGLLLVRFLPQRAAAPLDAGVCFTGSYGRASLALAGILVFYIALSGVWTFLERIGVANGLTAATIGRHLTLASVCGIAGCLAATALGARLRRGLPLLLGLALLVGSIILLMGRLSPAEFLLGSGGFKFAWTFALPFMLAVTASLDASGRILALANLMIGCGLALGPAVVAALLGDPPRYTVALWTGVIGGLASLSLLAASMAGRARA